MIQTRPLFTITLEVPRIVDLGAIPNGNRRSANRLMARPPCSSNSPR